MSISATPRLYGSAGDTDRLGCWHPARRQSRGKVGRIQFRAMSFMFGCGNHSPPAARFQGNSARQWSSPCVSHRLNTALTFRRKFELPAPQRCRIQVGVRWRNHVAAEVPTRVEGMYKGCTRDVQGTNTLATPEQYRNNTLAPPEDHARAKGRTRAFLQISSGPKRRAGRATSTSGLSLVHRSAG